jgi:hypothetical protein
VDDAARLRSHLCGDYEASTRNTTLSASQRPDRSIGNESVVDVRTLEVLASHQVDLTEAEQQIEGRGAYEAAQLSGEVWPSSIIIEMTRVMKSDVPVWRITTCDTEANTHSVIIVP